MCFFNGAWEIETSFSRLKETNELEEIKLDARKGGKKLKGDVMTLDGRRKSFSPVSETGREEGGGGENSRNNCLNERKGGKGWNLAGGYRAIGKIGYSDIPIENVPLSGRINFKRESENEAATRATISCNERKQVTKVT